MAGAEQAAVGWLLSLPEASAAGLWALYVELPGEVPTGDLRRRLAALGVRVALPRLEGTHLRLHESGPDDPLQEGPRGTRHPGPDRPAIDPVGIDLWVVPGLLFDREGGRLGRGGGHYDRLLAFARPDATRVGLCYAERVVERLPRDPWDVPMDVVVTEEGVIRPSEGAG